MSKVDKLLLELYKKPVPNDIRIDEVKKIVTHYGCETTPGGKHQLKIVHAPTGTIIPIPCHGDTVAEVYIKEIKKLLDKIIPKEDLI